MEEKKPAAAADVYVVDDATIDELKGTFGSIWTIDSDEGDSVAFRKPSPQEYKRYKETLLDDGKRKHAATNLLADVLVAPAFKTKEFRELFGRLPAFEASIEKEILRISGYAEGATARKA